MVGVGGRPLQGAPLGLRFREDVSSIIPGELGLVIISVSNLNKGEGDPIIVVSPLGPRTAGASASIYARESVTRAWIPSDALGSP
jgi:hypothetical protein